jgi:hypothetical protein
MTVIDGMQHHRRQSRHGMCLALLLLLLCLFLRWEPSDRVLVEHRPRRDNQLKLLVKSMTHENI